MKLWRLYLCSNTHFTRVCIGVRTVGFTHTLSLFPPDHELYSVVRTVWVLLTGLPVIDTLVNGKRKGWVKTKLYSVLKTIIPSTSYVWTTDWVIRIKETDSTETLWLKSKRLKERSHNFEHESCEIFLETLKVFICINELKRTWGMYNNSFSYGLITNLIINIQPKNKSYLQNFRFRYNSRT